MLGGAPAPPEGFCPCQVFTAERAQPCPAALPPVIPSAAGTVAKCHVKPGFCRGTLTGFIFSTMTSLKQEEGKGEQDVRDQKLAGAGWMLVKTASLAGRFL